MTTQPITFEAARMAYEAAEAAHDAACERAGVTRPPFADPPRDTLGAYIEARAVLMATPAATPADAAYKVATLLLGFTPLDGDLRREEERQWVAEHGDEADRWGLQLYFDVLNLSR